MPQIADAYFDLILDIPSVSIGLSGTEGRTRYWITSGISTTQPAPHLQQ
jgi:hypothetical protein